MDKVFVIAEAGVNHNGSVEMALDLIDVAAEAGADAVKFQTFKAEKEISRFAPKAEYQLATTDPAESQLAMAKKLEFDEAAHHRLLERCRRRQIMFLSAPSDLDSLELLTTTLDLSCIKIPSGELTNGLLLLRAASSAKSLILSTGMSTLGEVEAALAVLAYGYAQPEEPPGRAAFMAAYRSAKGRAALAEKVSLLHCTTEYPAPYDEVNLRAMASLRQAFQLPVGLSDHTVGTAVPVAAAALGAAIIEKHFTLDKTLPGPDHPASLEPYELEEMVRAIRQVETALGSPGKLPAPSEIKNIAVARKSLVASRPIQAGETLSAANITAKRPGDGLSPMLYWDYLGQRAKRAYQADEQID